MGSRPYDLIAFDVDGTLVREAGGRTVWEVLNEKFTGRGDHNKERFALYLQGKLSYAEWVDLDVSGWRDAGAKREDLIAGFEPLNLVDGTRETLETLKALGYRLVVVSGTIDLMLNTLLPEAPFDEIFANHIGFGDDGRISHWRATPFDMQGKAKILRAVAMRESIPLSRCAFVGDSGNDLWIAREAGFSIAFNSTNGELDAAADVVLRSSDLRSILPFFQEQAGGGNEAG